MKRKSWYTSLQLVRNHTCRFVLICFSINVFPNLQTWFFEGKLISKIFFHFMFSNYGNNFVLRNKKTLKYWCYSKWVCGKKFKSFFKCHIYVLKMTRWHTSRLSFRRSRYRKALHWYVVGRYLSKNFYWTYILIPMLEWILLIIKQVSKHLAECFKNSKSKSIVIIH